MNILEGAFRELYIITQNRCKKAIAKTYLPISSVLSDIENLYKRVKMVMNSVSKTATTSQLGDKWVVNFLFEYIKRGYIQSRNENVIISLNKQESYDFYDHLHIRKKSKKEFAQMEEKELKEILEEHIFTKEFVDTMHISIRRRKVTLIIPKASVETEMHRYIRFIEYKKILSELRSLKKEIRTKIKCVPQNIQEMFDVYFYDPFSQLVKTYEVYGVLIDSFLGDREIMGAFFWKNPPPWMYVGKIIDLIKEKNISVAMLPMKVGASWNIIKGQLGEDVVFCDDDTVIKRRDMK